MDDHTRLENIPPLGRSVEEVEAEGGNLVNPPAQDDQNGSTGNAHVVAPIPVVNPSAQGVQGTVAGSGAPIIGAYGVVNDFLVDDRREEDVNEKRTNFDPSDNSQT